MGRISIPEEKGVNIPTRKLIISCFSTPETMRFLVLKTFAHLKQQTKVISRLYFKIQTLTTISIS